MKKIKIFDIHWDTSDDDNVPSSESLGLPTEYTAEVDDDFDPDEQCADILSDKFGYCVLGCNWEWDRSALCASFWENVAPSLNGYSQAIDFLLKQISSDKLPTVVAEWWGVEK